MLVGLCCRRLRALDLFLRTASSIRPIPRRLTKALELAGMTQEILGSACGVDLSDASSRVSHNCTGRHTTNFQLLQRFSEVLRVPASYFYFSDDVRAALIVGFDVLPTKAKNTVSRMAFQLASTESESPKRKQVSDGRRCR